MKKHPQYSIRSSTYRKQGIRLTPFLFTFTLLLTIFLMCNTALALTGDIDGDGDVDRDDLGILLTFRNQPASNNPVCDIDGDGVITVLDARKLILLCTLPRCAIVETENSPPVANAGDDRVIALPEGQTAIDVRLDGSASSDPDGTVTGYSWTGTPDPDDTADPAISLEQGRYEFSLVVRDDKGAESSSDRVTVTVLGPPEIVAPPGMTTEPSVTVYGTSVPGVNVIIRGGAQDVSAQALPDNGSFQITVPLNSGENILSVYAEYNGVESLPTSAAVTRTTPTLALDSISPDTGQSGSVLTLTGSGFTPDKDEMGVYFKGPDQEAEGFVLDAEETEMKVVVPFVFLNTDDIVQVYVYSKTEMSNTLPFHVTPAADPTPGMQGNEVSGDFDHLVLQAQRTLAKLEQLVQPNVTDETWSRIEENINRIITFLENAKGSVSGEYDPQTLSALDSIFGSDIFSIISEKLDQVNEILNHSTTGEAICNVAQVQGILNDIIDILDWVEGALIAGEVICFFVCQPALPVLEVAREIVDVMLDVLYAIRDILDAASPTNADASSWDINVTGPYPGIDPRILFTDSENSLALNADFTNGGFNRFIGRISTIGKVVLDLLDINIGQFTIEDVNVPSTAQSSDTALVSNITTENNPETAADIHTLQVSGLPDDLDRKGVDIDVQGSCGPYHYPDTICKGTGCLDPDLPEYPEHFNATVIEAPIIDDILWDFEYSGWYVQGLGFSTMCGDVFKVYYNGEEMACGCLEDLDWDSFIASCTIFEEPGRIELMLVDPEDPYNPDSQRRGPSQCIGLPPGDELTIYSTIPQSGFIGDEIRLIGDHFSPYPEDMTLVLYDAGWNPTGIELQPADISYDWMPNAPDVLTFKIPEELHDRQGQSLNFELELTDFAVSYGRPGTTGALELKTSESAGWGDQDVIAFGKQRGYVRTALVDDISGDGINDLVVGIAEDQTASGKVMGSVYIAFGPVEGESVSTGQQYIDMDISAVPAHWDVVISGDYENCYLDGNFCRRIGNTLAAGDINGDGLNDLLIGTTDRNEDGLHDLNVHSYAGEKGHIPGRAYVYFGRPNAEWNRWYDIPYGEYDVVVHNDAQRELGYRVAAADLNGDARADMIISSPSQLFDPNDPDSDWSGRVYIIFGGSDLQRDIDVADIPGSVDGAVITGSSVWQEYAYKGNGFGEGIAVGDVNGDGADDLLVGAPRFLRTFQSYARRGAAFLFFGDHIAGSDGTLAADLWSGEQDVLIHGPANAQNMHPGTEVGKTMLIDDINNDSRGDIIFGVPDEYLDYEYSHMAATVTVQQDHTGRVYIIPGDDVPLSGTSDVGNLSETEIHGSLTISRLGASLAAADINSDGYKDLLAGAPGRTGSEEPGHVWGMYGSAGLPSGSIHLTDRSGNPDDFLFTGDTEHQDSRQGFGTYIAAGDLNPFVGDDVLVIDPLADAPEPGDPMHHTRRDYSGMLYVFYEGSNEYQPMSVSPENTSMHFCDSEETFSVYGGRRPYQYDWSGCYQTDPVLCTQYQNSPPENFYTEYGDNTVVLLLDGCIPENLASLRFRITDSRGEAVQSDISFLKPDIHISPSAIDFGDVNIGYTVERLITVSNTGDAALDISGTTFSGTADIQYTNNCPQTIPALESCTITTAFSPTSTGTKAAVLTVTSNDPDEPAAAVDLSGNGLAPLEPDIVIVGGNLVFTDVPLGTSLSQDIIIRNSGNTDLQITNISVSGASEFAVTSDNCTGTLPSYPPYTCTVTITFTPSVKDPVYGTISIESDDPDTPVFNGSLSGNGTASSISLNPLSVDFGEIPYNAVDSGNVSIGNTGDAVLHIENITYSGDSAFTVSNPAAPFDIEPGGEEQVVSIDFQPQTTGVFQGTITIQSNDPETPEAQIPLSGRGTGWVIQIGQTITDHLEDLGDEDIFEWVCTGDIISLDVDETEDGVIVDESASSIRTILYDPMQVLLANEVGGFEGVQTPDGGTCTLLLRSEVNRTVEYQFTVSVDEEGLTVSPEVRILSSRCFETGFQIFGGTEPYEFSLGDDPQIVELVENGILGFNYLGDNFVIVWSGCIPEDIGQLTLTVTDPSGAEGQATILFGGIVPPS